MRVSWWPHVAFWMGVALMAVLASALYGAAKHALEATSWLDHSHEVLGTISAVDEHVSRAEASQRGFLLSDNPAFLVERDQALANVDSALARLKAATSDNPAQAARIPALAAYINTRRALLNEQIARRQAGEPQINPASVLNAQRLSEAINAVTEDMQREERRLLQARQLEAKAQYDQALRLLFAAMGFGLLIVAPGYVGFIVQSRARARAEHRMVDLAESVPGAMYRARAAENGTWRFEFVSNNIARLHEVDRDTLMREPTALLQSVHPEDRSGLEAAIKRASDTLTYLDHEYRVLQDDGSVKWIRSSGAPRREADGAIVWNGVWADVTAHKTLERALVDAKEEADTANRAKSTFLAVMSHEIRTPLNGVLGMLELLSLTNLDHEQRTTLSVIRESGRALQRIIDDILDFSKIEAGKLEIAPVPSSVSDVVHGTRNIYAGNASSKGLVLKASVDPRISPALVVDPLRLRQILSNFVSNAIKFTSEGEIEIKAELVERRDNEERIRFAVRDTGMGIPEDARERLFQPYMQAGTDTARSFGGTGLGLTICRRLADMMGGAVEIQSAVGKGTTINLTLTLPIADRRELVSLAPQPSATSMPAELPPPQAAPSVAQAEHEGTLVLLVDDHPINRMVICKQANLLGYAAESADNGRDALNKWKSKRYAAVITDINMPEMDGYELARTIRRLESAEARRRIPIIACTANALRGEAEKCFAAGMDDYLAKPIQLSDLADTLRQWVPMPAHAASEGRAASASGTDTRATLDRSVLAEVSGGASEDEHAILEEFRRVSDADAAILQDAIEHGNAAQIISTAHRMKGASRMVGAVRLGDACARIEHAGRSNNLDRARASMPALLDELQSFARHIRGMEGSAAGHRSQRVR